MHRYDSLRARAIAFPNALLHVVLVVLYCLGAATSLPTQNITIEVPNGTTNHGDSHLLCTPTRWTDIVTFLLFNFFAHAATVVSYPGESGEDVILAVIGATLFPTSGAMRGLNSIMRHSVLSTNDPLQKAARSGALCMLVRSPSWKPEKGDAVTDVWVVETSGESLLWLISNFHHIHRNMLASESEAIIDGESEDIDNIMFVYIYLCPLNSSS
jgi:hypothetical protein